MSRRPRRRRRRPSRWWPLAAWGLCWASAAPAQAEQSVWSRARQPALHRQQRTLRKVDRLLLEARQARRGGALSGPTRTLLLRDAQAKLGELGAARSPNPYVRERLARALYGLYELDGDPEHLRGAVAALRFVTAAQVPRTVLAEAHNDLAICLARLGEHRAEIDAYQEAIRLDPHAESRAVLLANQAEGFMLLGNITAAVAGYRASLAVTPPAALHHVAVTTWWGLAVALDRSGDLEGGLAQIGRARSYDPSDRRLASDTWFYLPSYDEHWYAALGHWQSARSADSRAARLAAFQLAIEGWRKFLSLAPATDPWAALAGARLSQCEREHRRALARGE